MFSREEVQLLWNITNLCAEARSERDLIGILQGPLRAILPHGCSAYGLCRPSTDTVLRVQNIDFPAGFVQGHAQAGASLASPLAAQWKREGRVSHLAAGGGTAAAGQAMTRSALFEAWHERLRAYGLRSITAHGATDHARDLSSYFAFGNTGQELSERDRTLVSIIVPHLHNALLALPQPAPAAAAVAIQAPVAAPDSASGDARPEPPAGLVPGHLSGREVEVLKWVQVGKTNYEIGLILSISEFTVKNHMQRILNKLNASNRAHAISKATHVGLIAPVWRSPQAC